MPDKYWPTLKPPEEYQEGTFNPLELTMTDSTQLNNKTSKYPELTWTKNEYHQLQLALDALKNIRNREDRRHEMDQHLTPETAAALDEAISLLSDELDYDPTPNEPGEPPITAAEMHASAWREHLEAHR